VPHRVVTLYKAQISTSIQLAYFSMMIA
jgi:hypothetical protein